MIAWTSPDPEGFGQCLHFLVEGQGGFSNDIKFCSSGVVSVMVDGPYGAGNTLHDYDKLLFVVYGVGIGAYLLTIRDLLRAHEARTARARRICLVWQLDSLGKSSTSAKVIS